MEKREGGLDDLSVDDILGIKGNRGGLAVYSQANLDSPQNIELHYGKFLKPLKKELVVVVLLNPKLRRIKDVVVSIGDLTRSVIHPREVFMPAIKESAWAIVLVHNHPSGDPTPSKRDKEITRQLFRTGEIVGIRLLDHIVIGNPGHYSFAAEGMLPNGFACRV